MIHGRPAQTATTSRLVCTLNPLHSDVQHTTCYQCPIVFEPVPILHCMHAGITHLKTGWADLAHLLCRPLAACPEESKFV